VKKIFPIIASISVLIIAFSVGYYFEDIIKLPTRSSFYAPKPIPAPTATPVVLDKKTIKAQCVEELREYIELNKNKKMTSEESIWIINTRYRLCLAQNGLTPEDLLSNPAPSQNNQGTYYREPFVQEPVVIEEESLTEKFKREQQQRCQEEINKYNICMNEYNSEMGEYNACLSEVNDPNHWRYGLRCNKPFSSCYKPICAY